MKLYRFLRTLSLRFVFTLLAICAALAVGGVTLRLRFAKPAVQAKLSNSQGEAAARSMVLETYRNLPLRFEPNLGQSDPRVKFLARGPGYTVFLTPDGAALSLGHAASKPQVHSAVDSVQASGSTRFSTAAAVHMRLLNANPSAAIMGRDELPGTANYFLGSDPAKWHTDVQTFAKVAYQDVYPGVDLVYHGAQGQLEYDFVIAAGADPQPIALSFPDARRLRVDIATGDLIAQAGTAQVRFLKPVAYQVESSTRSRGSQAKLEIAAGYVVDARNRVTFNLGPYDHSKPLVIDPTLSYSTYIGGSSDDYAMSIAVDSEGSAYITGYTNSTNYPSTAGVFQTRCYGGCKGTSDAFITKFDPDGTALAYSTYLGGMNNDYGNGITLDSQGNAYVVGQTFSSNFPITAGAYQTSCGGGSCGRGQAFITKLNSTGSALIYSTFLGGSGGNQGNSIVLDSNDDAYITGYTTSTDFPVSSGAYQTKCSCSTKSDAFVTQLNSNGTGLVYSTYLGGSSTDVAYGITLDSSNNAYITGYTESVNFPTTKGAYQTSPAADKTAFVTKLNPRGTALVYSTYLGGSSSNLTTPCEACATSIAVNSAGNAYVSGLTAESNFPVTSNAFQKTRKSSAQGHNAFITEFNTNGTGLVFSTYLGGSKDTGSTAIEVDASGNVWVKGNTEAPDFPVTAGAFQSTAGGSFDFFLTELDSTGSALLYSTYLGGSGTEYGGATKSLVLDSNNPPTAYVTGYTNSTNYPTSPGVFQPSLKGLNNAVVAKFSGN